MELTNHFFLQAKNRGYNQRLIDNVAFVYILVSDPVSHWKNQVQVDSCIQKIKQVSDMLTQEARKQHVNLRIKDFVLKSSSNDIVSIETAKGWHTRIIQRIHRASLKELQNEIKKSQDFTEVAVIFLFNRVDRCFAHQVVNNLYDDEFAVAYAACSANDIAHEILHVFGAVDFYYMEQVRKAAEKHLQGGLMMGNTREIIIDDLNMYLIGWHQKLSWRATAFLKEVQTVTRAEWEASLKTKVVDGNGRIVFSNGDIYEGALTHGQPNGYGTYYFKDGSRYIGDVRSGKLHGHGKIIYANGDQYEGSLKDSKLEGRGVLSRKNGDYYVGEFSDNTYNGYGEYHYAFGKIKKGYWKNGKLIL